MPEEVKNLCRLADIHSKSLLLQIVRQGDPQKMVALVEKISRDGGATREAVRKETAKPKAGRPKALRLQLQGAHQGVQPAAPVHQVRVDRDEVIAALEAIIKELRAELDRSTFRASSRSASASRASLRDLPALRKHSRAVRPPCPRLRASKYRLQPRSELSERWQVGVARD